MKMEKIDYWIGMALAGALAFLGIAIIIVAYWGR